MFNFKRLVFFAQIINHLFIIKYTVELVEDFNWRLFFYLVGLVFMSYDICFYRFFRRKFYKLRAAIQLVKF